MNEDFLHYLWKYRYFKNQSLKTETGERLEIINTGTYNRNAGPDFLNAKIKIGNTVWAGNIEIHKSASDWYKHKHEINPAYKNVILHVVYNNDRPVKDVQGNQLLTFVLKNYIPQPMMERYRELMLSKETIACSKLYAGNPDINIKLWLSRLAVERLEMRSQKIQHILNETQSDWETTGIRFLASFYGMKTNNEAFNQLMQLLPLKAILKQRNSLLQIEAMLFGQAALLPDKTSEVYVKKLITEYQFLKKKYKLSMMQKGIWKFSRLRPANFPTLRIAQFAAVLQMHPNLLSAMLSCRQIQDLKTIFSAKPADYWINHYRFNKKSTIKKHQAGDTFLNNLLINACIPLIFYYGKMHQKHEYINKALFFMDQLKAEQNRIIRLWKTMHIIPENASESQALLQLKNYYCDKYRCLDCLIGHKILQRIQ